MIALPEHRRTIGLEELIAIADLQTRRDRKYLLPAEVADRVLASVEARELDIGGLRTFRYESIYFDTEGWDSYLGAARRRPRRFKVRIRTYVDSNECMLEVKVRDHRGNTVKHRHPYDVCARDRLTTSGTSFISTVEGVAAHAADLHPVLTVSYLRSTLVLDQTLDRVTVDRRTRWCAEDETARTLHGLVLLETKTAGPASPVDRLLWKAGHRPVTISKYCTGLALSQPGLPSNKWHRVLYRNVLPHINEEP